MARAGILVAGAVGLAVVAAGVLASTNFLGIDLPFFKPSERELVTRMTEVTALGGFAVTFAESDAPRWQLAPGQKLERFSLGDGQFTFARLTSSGALDNETPKWSERGLSFTLPLEFSNRSKGRRVEIGVVARSSQANSAGAFSIVYATQQAGNSGWQVVELSPIFELKTFVYTVPSIDGEFGNSPIVVVHSDADGKGHSTELLGIYVKILPLADS